MMKNPSKNFLLATAVIISVFAYVQGVVVPNTALKYEQAAVAKSTGSSRAAPTAPNGTITIVKSVSPAAYTDFAFTINAPGYPSTFYLDNDDYLPNPSPLPNHTSFSVPNGIYTFSESPLVPGYTPHVYCYDPSGGTYTTVTGASIGVSNYETVTCTVRNIATPTSAQICVPSAAAPCGKVIIIKDAVPDDPQDFDFTTNIPGYPTTFTLDDDSTLPNPSALQNIQTFSTPASGLFTVTENPQAPWSVNIACTDPSGGTTISGNTANISMTGAEAITCTFKNTNPTMGQACTPDTWTQKANFGGGAISQASSFTLNNLLYVGPGVQPYSNYTNGVSDSLWQYDPVTNIWTQKANFGGGSRTTTLAFSINNFGYIGLGTDNAYPVPNFFNDLWQYDPVTDTWTQVASLPASGRAQANSFSIGNNGYIGGGYTVQTTLMNFNDFWEYDSVNNSWTQKTPMPVAPERVGSFTFSINGLGYVGAGFAYFSSPYILQDLWQYDPVTDTWTQKANFGGGLRHFGYSFVLNSKGYAGGGHFAIGSPPFPLLDLWQYDPVTDTWTQKANFGGGSRSETFNGSVGNHGYVGGGWTNWTTYQDFWEYCP